MADSPTFSRMPGSDDLPEAFDVHEVAGMRTAGWILLATAAVTLLSWAVVRTALPSPAILIDAFLGAQLLRRRHSWRAWALLRSGLGLLISGLAIWNGLSAGSAALGLTVSGVGQMAYCLALLLLLLGVPTARRIVLGRITFGIAVVLILLGGALIGVQPQAGGTGAPGPVPTANELSFPLGRDLRASSQWFSVEQPRAFAIVLDVQGPLSDELRCELDLPESGKPCAPETVAALRWELSDGQSVLAHGTMAASPAHARLGSRVFREIGRFRVEPGRQYRVSVFLDRGVVLPRALPVIGLEAVDPLT